MRKTRVVLCLLALCAVAAQAEVYKWVDADGKIQYGDAPPKDVKASKVSGGVTVMPAFTPPPAAAPAAAPKTESAVQGPAVGGISAKPEKAAASSAAPVSDKEAARLRMIEACERNRGVDCEESVDAQLYGQGSGSTVYVPVPGWSQPPIRPNPKPRPPAQSSAPSQGSKEPAKGSNPKGDRL